MTQTDHSGPENLGPPGGPRSADKYRPAFIFTRPGLGVTSALLVLGAWYDRPALVMVSGMLLALALAALAWSRLALARVAHFRRLSADRAFPGEEVELTIGLENRKLLPLTWLEAADEIPTALASAEDAPVPAFRPGRQHLVSAAPLLWYRRHLRKYRLACRRRGYYLLGPAVLTSGDPFGFLPRRRTFDHADHLLVYPKVFDLTGLAMPSRFPIGEAKAASRLFEDPTRVMGSRQYTRDVSFRHIHWKASARHQELQVKVFEPTTTLEAAVFLPAEGFEKEEDFEFGVSLAASLARQWLETGHPAGCFSNAAPADHRSGSVALRPGSGGEQLRLILESLAKIEMAPGRPFEDLFQEALAGLNWGATVCLVTARPLESMLARLEDLIRTGFQAVVCQVGEAGPAPGGTVPWLSVGGPEQLDRVRSWGTS
ncbi:MAG: DUF58 domain-containing protein [Thermodesulfobacteriota bacterium]